MVEVGFGAALGGARTPRGHEACWRECCADPLMTSVLTGINSGLVIISADDPRMHSSQNESVEKPLNKTILSPTK